MSLWTDRDAKRFASKFVAKQGLGGCWRWRASTSTDGYGVFYFAGRMVRAHRVSYSLTFGDISVGLTIDHLCRVRDCVNPAHLEAVTIKENSLRGETINADHASRTHCPAGHPLEGDNLSSWQLERGRRMCLTCNREHARARATVMRKAAVHLGLGWKAYVRTYGGSRRTAEQVLEGTL